MREITQTIELVVDEFEKVESIRRQSALVMEEAINEQTRLFIASDSARKKVDDATIRTAIVESISDVYAKLNQTRARLRQRREILGSSETIEQFAAQFKLFGQSSTNALGEATTPDKCEEQLTRLLVQLEEMESQFGEHQDFLSEILTQREEIYNAFETQKQNLLDRQNARAQMLSDTLKRMLDNIEKRTQRFETDDELNTYLAADAMPLKLRDIVEQLRDMGSAVKADDAEGRLKMIQDQALRILRDRADLYLEGGRVIKLGPRHRFSVSTDSITNAPSKAFDDVLEILNGTITHMLVPLIRRMDNRIAQDVEAHRLIKNLRADVTKLKTRDKK